MKRSISFSIFIIIAIVAWWSTTKDHGNTDPQHIDKNARYVEVFMNDFEITQMDESGIPSFMLTGKHLQRFNRSDDTEMKLPVFRLMQKGNEWKVTAAKAILNEKKDTIDLVDDVVMQQQNIEPAVTIRTQSLTINTKQQTAFTTAKVNITQGNSVLHSDGMIFDNLTSNLKLTSNVNGFFWPIDK